MPKFFDSNIFLHILLTNFFFSLLFFFFQTKSFSYQKPNTPHKTQLISELKTNTKKDTKKSEKITLETKKENTTKMTSEAVVEISKTNKTQTNKKTNELKLNELKKIFQNNDPLKYLPIQSGGRIKPFDSFAKESLQLIYGKKSYKKQEATTILFTWLMIPGLWETMDLIHMNSYQIKKDLGLNTKNQRFSPKLLRTNERLALLIQELRNKKEKKDKLNSYFKDIERIENQMNLFYAISLHSYLPVVPSKKGSSWKSPPELQGHLKTSFETVRKSFVQNLAHSSKLNQLSKLKTKNQSPSRNSKKDYEFLKEESKEVPPEKKTLKNNNQNTSLKNLPPLDEALASFVYQAMNENPKAYANFKKIKIEVFYNSLKPFKLSWILYLIALIFFSLSLLFKKQEKTKTKKNQKNLFYKIGWCPLILAFFIHLIGMVLRVYIAERPPVSNMYETLIWVPWGSVLFGIILELRSKTVLPILSSSIVASLCLIVSSMAPTILDPAIEPLQAVLRDNFWLVFHVLIICLSYAAFFLSFFLSDILLFFILLNEKKYKTQIKQGVQTIYRSLQVGVLLLLIGIILGGIWADLSWGRFWGWDPKETWALIALLGYIALLHGRIGGWLKDFGMIIGSITAFSLVLMAWYGVNFILGEGLHSYGFSSGGNGFVFTFVALHFLYVLYAVLQKRQKKQLAK